jgi:RNA polymerase sporulation-specific sigma factor
MTDTQIVQKYANLVGSQLYKFNSHKNDIEDLKQNGFIGLIKANRTWDKNKNAKFITYAAKCIYNEMLKYVINNKQPITRSYINNKVSYLDNTFEYYELFNKTQCEIVKMRYKGFTIKEIALAQHKSVQWTDKQLQNIRKILKDA